jgi:hypothetical protein
MAKGGVAVRTALNVSNVKPPMSEAIDAEQCAYLGLLTSLKPRHKRHLVWQAQARLARGPRLVTW